jgi:hypothetical protein
MSTSNLNAHIATCEGQRPSEQKSIQPFAHGSTYSKEKLRVFCALWAATAYRPFAIVKDDLFRDIIDMFNPAAVKDIPSEMTVARDVREFFDIGKENVKTLLTVRCIPVKRSILTFSRTFPEPYTLPSTAGLLQTVARSLA